MRRNIERSGKESVRESRGNWKTGVKEGSLNGGEGCPRCWPAGSACMTCDQTRGKGARVYWSSEKTQEQYNRASRKKDGGGAGLGLKAVV